MSLHHWLQNRRSALAPARSHHRSPRRAAMHRPRLEILEDRTVPSFAAPVSYAAGAGATVVTADFNGDSRLDVAAWSGDISILLGKADGTFQAAGTFASGGSHALGNSLAVSDFNGDGKLDIVMVVGNSGPDFGQVSLLLGNGDGTFQSPRIFSAGPTHVVGLAVGDFNADGKMDVAVSGQANAYFGGQNEFRMLLGNGDGTFASYDNFNSLFDDVFSGFLAAGDFNGDGELDLAMLGGDGGVVFLGNGDGSFHGSGFLNTNLAPSAGAVADLNGDGKLDLAVVAGGVSVLLGNGDGTFQNASNYACDNYPLSVAVADFNGDGKPDVVTSGYKFSNGNYNSPPIGVTSVFLGNGDGAFQAAQYTQAGSDTESLAAGDFNGDGRPDVAVGDYSGPLLVLLNTGDSVPLPPSLKVNDVTVTEGNTGTRAATFTVTLSAASTQTVTVAYATGNGTATAGSDYSSTSGTLTFAPGQTSETITVLVKGDRIPEPNETFFVNLSNPNNATIADGQGLGTIMDDEPRISISDVSMKEGNSGLTAFAFRVSLSAAYDVPVTVAYSTANGTATAGNDYQAATGTLTIPAGQTSRTITVLVNRRPRSPSRTRPSSST